LTRARSDVPLLTDLQTMMPHLMRNVDRIQAGEKRELGYDEERTDPGPLTPPAESQPKKKSKKVEVMSRNGSEPITVLRAPSTQAGPPPIDIDPELTAKWLVAFLREEFERRNFSRAVVGLSGGVDSAVTSFLAAEAL